MNQLDFPVAAAAEAGIGTAPRLRILQLEDDPDDAAMVRHELRRAGIEADTLHVISRADFEAGLDPCPDAILADYRLPNWTGLDALRLVRGRGLDVPFIVVSGTIGEDVAVEAMRHGADDYLLKDRLARLGPALAQALERKRLRAEANQAAAALREREAGLLQAQRIARLAHAVTGPDGAFESWWETLPQLIGVEPALMPKSTREWLTLLHPDDRAMFRNKIIEAAKARSQAQIEYRLRRGDGAWIQIRHVIEPLADRAGAAGGTRWFNTVQDLTDQKRSSDELRRFQFAMDMSVDSIYLTDVTQSRFVYVNEMACRRLGYARDRLLQMGPQDVLGREPAEIRQEYDSVIQAGEPGVRFDSRFLRSDGSEGMTEIHRRAVMVDGRQLIVTIGRDITERKRAQEAILREKNFSSAMLDSLPGLFYLINDQGRFLRWNRNLEMVSGYSAEEMSRLSATDLFVESDRNTVTEKIGRVLQSGEATVEAGFLAKDGTRTAYFFTGKRVAIDQKPCVIGMGFDVTERRLADERIRRLNRVYAVLSGINGTIVRVNNRDKLLQEACRIAVEQGGFGIAQVLLVDEEACEVWPGPSAGIDALPVAHSSFRPGAETISTQGTTIRAIRARGRVFTNDITAEPPIGALRQEALRRGYGSVISLPLVVGGRVVAVLLLCAKEKNFFDDQELRLLDELADDIAFALDHIEKGNRLDYLAYYDALTGLANRSLFHERLAQYAHAAQQREGKLALVLLDLERFKTINDSLGRTAGDELLKQLAERLACAINPGDIARIGADHFAIVLPQIKGRSEAARSVERIWRECFAQSFHVNGTELRIAAKAGIALYPSDGANAETLFSSAEAALQNAQLTGERQLFHAPNLTAGVADQLALENRLRQALEKDEFVLHYQPKVDLGARQIVGVEALIRWQSPELGLVPPLSFIPLMEETGMILEVGAWALKRAALDHRGWVEQGLKAPRIAVNVSPIQLRQRDFVAVVEQAILEGLAPTGIDLEITESLIMDDVQGNIGKLNAVRKLGVQIAIDDFGTGYSSLGYLAKLPVQMLKIDRSFIITMLQDAGTMTLVQTMISLAHSLRLKVVAEGVDAEEQAKVLHLLRCDQMQGYLVSKPVPAADLATMLDKIALRAAQMNA